MDFMHQEKTFDGIVLWNSSWWHQWWNSERGWGSSFMSHDFCVVRVYSSTAMARPILLCTCQWSFTSCRHSNKLPMCKHDRIEGFLDMQPPVCKCCLHVIENPHPKKRTTADWSVPPERLEMLQEQLSGMAGWDWQPCKMIHFAKKISQMIRRCSKVMGVPPNHLSY